MTAAEKIPLTIRSSIKECDTHLRRMNRGLSLLAEFFPVTEEILLENDDMRIEHIDQFIYRFTKLQDSMGTRLLPSLYGYLKGNDQPVPFLDILNTLEKMGIITSAADWQFFRNLRNNLAHDYPDSVDQTVLTLNLLYSEFGRLEALYTNVRQYCAGRIEGIQ
jgi:hypothetical protein